MKQESMNISASPKLETRIEQLLESDNETFKQLIKNSFDILVLLSADGKQYFVSESCKKILGYSPEELMDISVIDEMIHPEDQEKVRNGLKGIVEKSKHGGTQYRHRHKDGGWIYLEAVGTNQLDNPSIQSVVLNVRDITERKKAEQALRKSEERFRQLNATKDRFFSIIGHDLKNPFSSILGFSELLVDQVRRKEYEEAEEYAEIIRDSSKRAMDLLTNLLMWAQSQTGKVEYQPDYLNLQSLVNEVIDLVHNFAKNKSIRIENKISKDISLFADKAMISLVIRNLLSNGIKFTNTGGSILVNVEKMRDQYIVSIADNGVGIKEEYIDKLFSVENSYSTNGTNHETGTGLGLILCKDFVEMHGGEIWVESDVNRGSTFRFTIPGE